MDYERLAEDFVAEEVPSHLFPRFPPALRRAYATADATIDRDPYLATPGGRYQRGDLILLAASYEFEQMLLRNQLPFDGAWEHFAKPTGKHFVMCTPRSHITISQVSDPTKRPRRAQFRANFCEYNERYLFAKMNEEVDRKRDKAIADGDRRLLHILHGYQSLQFIHLAYPHPESAGHIFKTDNLLLLPHVVSDDLPPAEGPSESPDPEVLENLTRHLRDDD